MRPVLIGLASFVAPGLIFLACGQDPGTATTSTSSTSGAGGVPNCEGVNFIYHDDAGCDPCDVCAHRECCAELAACREKTCIDCVTSHQPECSDSSVRALKCMTDHCSDACPPAKPMSTGGGGACGDMSSSSASSG